MPAQKSRSQAAPLEPMSSTRPTETASPSWTQSIDATAIEAPVRARERVMGPVKDIATVRVHVTFLDVSFT
ncbi:hypothetical protein GCM10009797_34270 [Nocardioides hwasunensis]